ncbi:MAG: hypothetical protein IJM96_10415 [Clostridia bacterium]|nr:hypothetical protein [Clostridia bacterium]MBQ9986271.1 hypothetical protein [Oscillospiraceae bacterium]
MKKWYLWFVLAAVYALGGVLNYLDGKSITGAIVQVSIASALAFIQFFCDRNGEKGKKTFKYIAIILVFALVGWIIWMIFGMFI